MKKETRKTVFRQAKVTVTDNGYIISLLDYEGIASFPLKVARTKRELDLILKQNLKSIDL